MRDVDKTAAVQVVHIVHDLSVGCGVGGRQAAVIGGEEKLADLFVDVFAGWVLSGVRDFGGDVGHKNDQRGREQKQNASSASFHQQEFLR